MKQLLNILFSTALIAASTSCNKFMEQASQDLIRPVSVEHYKELLQGEAYFKDIYRHGWFVDVMTDNITVVEYTYPANLVNTKVEFAKHAYQWSQDLEAATGTFTDKLFQTLYKNVLTANTCLESIDKMEGTDDEKNFLKGQALFTRAYGYFTLASLYGPAYNEAAATDLCVPLTLETTPSLKRYMRATMGEVWKLIADDITEAVTLLEKDRRVRSVYEINYKAALVLASRIFLHTEAYEKAIQYGEKFLLEASTLKDITAITLSPNPGGTITNKSFLYQPENPEIVFTFGRIAGAASEGGYVHYTREIVGLSPMVFGASSNVESPLIESYGANDRRKTFWFSQPAGTVATFFSYPSYTPMKFNFYDGSRTTQNMRTGEVYLNLAEAYARKTSPDKDKTLELLNKLRNHRISSNSALSGSDFIDQESLTKFVWEERRRELCFEEFHRWWDLRRTGQPQLEHVFMGEEYTLRNKDLGYVLNFPRSEMEFNPELTPNPRPVRNAN